MKLMFKILFCGILTSIISACAIGENKDVDDSNWEETYATLYRYGYGRGAVNMVYYQVDGKTYGINGYFNPNGKALGDKYLIKYNPNSPEQIKEYVWTVGFLTTEKTNQTRGMVKSIWSRSIEFGRVKRKGITFIYFVNKKKYERTQYLRPNYKEKYPNLSEGQEYKVLYWDENPQRAVIYLNEPIKENNEY